MVKMVVKPTYQEVMFKAMEEMCKKEGTLEGAKILATLTCFYMEAAVKDGHRKEFLELLFQLIGEAWDLAGCTEKL